MLNAIIELNKFLFILIMGLVAGVENPLKVVVRAEILLRDFLQTLGNYHLSLTIAKFIV